MPTMTRRLLTALPFVLIALTAGAAEPATDVYGDPLPQGAVTRLGTARLRHQAHAIAFATDGKTFATGGADATIRLWDAANGKEIRAFKGHINNVMAVAFSADGKKLYSTGIDRTIREWDVAEGKELRTLKTQQMQPFFMQSLIVHPTEARLLTMDPAAIHEFDLKEDKETRTVAIPRNGLVTLCPDGKHFVTVQNNTVVTLRDLDDKEVQRFELDGTKRQVRRLSFSADGKTLAAACSDLAVVVWDVKTGKEVGSIPRAGGSNSLALSANGRFIAAKLLANSVRVMGVASGQELRAFDVPNLYGEVLAFSPDNKRLACCQSNTIYVWNLETSQPITDFVGHANAVEAVRFAPDGKRLTSAARDGSVIWWDLATSRPAAQRSGAATSGIRLSPDGRAFYYGLYGGVTRGELTDGKATEQPLVREPNVFSNLVAMSADGKVLAARGRDQSIHFYSTADGKEVGKLPPEGSRFAYYAFSADGSQLASGSNVVMCWDVPSGTQARQFDLRGTNPNIYAGLTGLLYSPDNRSLLTLTTQGVVVWEAAVGRERWRGPKEITGLTTGAFSHDGRLAAVGVGTGTVYLLDTATGAQLAEWPGHRGPVRGLDFSADGKRLASASEDGTVLVWDTGELSKKVRPEPVKLTEKQVADLWQDLGSVDSAKAHKAVRALADSPQGVAYVPANVKGGEKFDDTRAKKLIAQLDDDDFDVREKAEKDLAGMGTAVHPLLRDALKNPPSVEVKTRLERLLEPFKDQQVSTEQLRSLRAVEVLETSGSDDARKALKALAGGDAKDSLTIDAKAALERFQRRSANHEK